jgi:hypothetical protein
MPQDVPTGGVHKEGAGSEILAQAGIMIDTALLAHSAKQIVSGNAVEVDGKSMPVFRTQQTAPEDSDLHNERTGVFGHRAKPREAESLGAASEGRTSGGAVQGHGNQQICGRSGRWGGYCVREWAGAEK